MFFVLVPHLQWYWSTDIEQLWMDGSQWPERWEMVYEERIDVDEDFEVDQNQAFSCQRLGSEMYNTSLTVDKALSLKSPSILSQSSPDRRNQGPRTTKADC